MSACAGREAAPTRQRHDSIRLAVSARTDQPMQDCEARPAGSDPHSDRATSSFMISVVPA